MVMAALIVWCAILWRFRGGAFTTLTGINPGTDGIRVDTCFAIAAPIAWLHGLVWLSIAPAAVVGLILTGWAPEMGLIPPNPPESSWMRWLPERLGLNPGTLAHDFLGMAEAGIICVAPVYVVASLIVSWCAWPVLVAGLGFAPAYALARVMPVKIPRFAAGQEWGEVFAGAALGAALAVVSA
jgi:hypothetical protein